ncbi:DeoR/GlpR transcriptional regulator [Streptomyces samsunensis]|uniref:Lactose phosphotransferase system repressor n=3 Tax=Streptomyces TaxID=1883 RepID=A0ABX6VWR3_STRMQ|nr:MULTISPECIES: DeoR/GlpR family DNA-binding transcription regulator [Streptomyces]MYU12576.1 DeoR family transcriptional regulator [Streptomyces sp. SID8361]AQA09475.1 DeoR family transcriptional regulator [Streptomyces autolyticus]AUA16699.1 Glycerol-3-phosphate regulon repressor [Streptomyces sp. M56]MCD9586584.1 DeoR/GlpR family DNA-binding transcription regulator [Streptomyces sp. 8ZJF_21]MCM3806736.1 DeoR/GlpR family DNA-binding transcription regulator [Streptomyces sp. DR7-3]
MLAAERHRRIVAEIARIKFVTTDDLTTLLRVSHETIRRDLALLERQGELVRVHGGATAAQTPVGEEASFSERSDAFAAEKQTIGRAAAALIEPNQTIVIDVGTTALEVARALPADHVGVIATPSLLVAAEVSTRPRAEVLVSGGRLRGGDLACSNAQAVEFFSNLRADAVFLGSGGLAPYGLTDYHLDEVATKRVMLANASHRYVLADSSKFGRTAAHRVCELSGFDTLITDQPCPAELRTALIQAGGSIIAG